MVFGLGAERKRRLGARRVGPYRYAHASSRGDFATGRPTEWMGTFGSVRFGLSLEYGSAAGMKREASPGCSAVLRHGGCREVEVSTSRMHGAFVRSGGGAGNFNSVWRKIRDHEHPCVGLAGLAWMHNGGRGRNGLISKPFKD